MATITKTKRKLVKRSAELWFWRVFEEHGGAFVKAAAKVPEDLSWDFDVSFCAEGLKEIFAGSLGLRTGARERKFRVTIEEIPE